MLDKFNNMRIFYMSLKHILHNVMRDGIGVKFWNSNTIYEYSL